MLLRNVCRRVPEGQAVASVSCGKLIGSIITSLEQELPSCLVLDVQLPDINGFELQQQLAKKDLQVPIIFLTGYGDIPQGVPAMKAGAIEFLTKPFRDEELLNAITQAIERGAQIERLKNDAARKHPFLN